MGTKRSEVDKLDSEILDAMGELIAALIGRSEQIAQRFGVPAFCLKALHVLESSMAMRDLGKHMHCDPSFVTAIADLLEKRGLARPGGRRPPDLGGGYIRARRRPVSRPSASSRCCRPTESPVPERRGNAAARLDVHALQQGDLHAPRTVGGRAPASARHPRWRR